MLQNFGEAPNAAPASDLIADTTTQTFVKDVVEESKHRPLFVISEIARARLTSRNALPGPATR